MDKHLHQLINKKYEKGITLITPTGDRHLCMGRCQEYIKRQTYTGPLQWIISDDGKAPYTNIYLNQHYIRLKHPGDKVKSFLGNLRAILPEIKYDKVLVIEDDDWYHPEYIDIYRHRLENYQLVGEGPARYYNVMKRVYKSNGNTKRASFCQTGLRAEILNCLYISCQRQSAFVDARLWNKDACRKFIFQDKCHCIGIKGMPGRKGIGIGHRPGGSFKHDPEMNKLEQWIGKEDADFYRSIQFR